MDTRSYIKETMVPLSTAGNTIQFRKQGLRYYSAVGATATAISCPAYTAMPVGLQFTLDNSNGSSDMTLTPTTGTAIVANAGEVWDCVVTAAGTIFAGQYTAAPTS